MTRSVPGLAFAIIISILSVQAMAHVQGTADEGASICGAAGPGVTEDGTCVIAADDPYGHGGWVQWRETPWMDCPHLYMVCYDSSYVGWGTPQIWLEGKPR